MKFIFAYNHCKDMTCPEDFNSFDYDVYMFLQTNYVKISHLDFDVQTSDVTRLLEAGIIELDSEDRVSYVLLIRWLTLSKAITRNQCWPSITKKQVKCNMLQTVAQLIEQSHFRHKKTRIRIQSLALLLTNQV